eukprot:7120297-Prymnesium_polylepis.1
MRIACAFTCSCRAAPRRARPQRTHFVHCVKPNTRAQPSHIVRPLVAKQLHCLGTLDAVRLMGHGFPTRVPYDQLRRCAVTRTRTRSRTRTRTRNPNSNPNPNPT